MRAVRYHRYGPPDVLGIEQMAKPVPGTGLVDMVHTLKQVVCVKG